MAAFKANLMRALLNKMHETLSEFETNCAAERSAGKDKVLDLDGPDTDVISPPDEHQGAMDSRRRGRGVPMAEAFPDFTMNGDLRQPKK